MVYLLRKKADHRFLVCHGDILYKSSHLQWCVNPDKATQYNTEREAVEDLLDMIEIKIFEDGTGLAHFEVIESDDDLLDLKKEYKDMRKKSINDYLEAEKKLKQ